MKPGAGIVCGGPRLYIVDYIICRFLKNCKIGSKSHVVYKTIANFIIINETVYLHCQ